jgi:hypothetical protein
LLSVLCGQLLAFAWNTHRTWAERPLIGGGEIVCACGFCEGDGWVGAMPQPALTSYGACLIIFIDFYGAFMLHAAHDEFHPSANQAASRDRGGGGA